VSLNRESAIERAKKDLARRLNIAESDIETASVSDEDFPNSSLGAPVEDEMAAQMISSGWKIKLKAGGENYEYRADKYQLRLCGFQGTNHIIES
jgi:hypothetical protein